MKGRNPGFHFGRVKFEVLGRYPSIEWAFSSREKSELRIYIWESCPLGGHINERIAGNRNSVKD